MVLITIMYYSISIIFLVLHYKRYSITPSLVFVAMQLLMFSGIIRETTANTDYGRKLIGIYFLSLLCFLLGVLLINGISNTMRRNTLLTDIKQKDIETNYFDIEPTKYQMRVVIFLVVISIFICSYYFAQAGINVFVESFKDIFRGDSVIYATNRADFTSISGAGYIYQFRTSILPLLNLYLLLGQNNKVYKKLGIWILPLTIIFLLGTGQRNAFVFVVLISLLNLYLIRKNYKIRINYTAIIILVFTAVFFLGILTITNGRVSNDSGNVVVATLSSLSSRVFDINQNTALNAFKYIETQSTVWGYDWLMMLSDILPGKSGYMPVDRIIFYIAYGNYNGTGPPDIWGSAWYNWSWLGVTIFPTLLGLIYQGGYRHYRNIPKTKFHVLFYSALCTHLGMWFCGGPVVLFNDGVVTVLIMMVVILYKPIKSI